MQERIKIAIQSKGRLSENSIKYLNDIGIQFKNIGRNIIKKNESFEIMMVRDDDIPQYVKYGVVDFGIVGEDVLLESKLSLLIQKRLDFSKCKLVIAVKDNSDIADISQLNGERIATSYKNILSNYLLINNINASIIPIAGAVEIAPSINLSDAICDITQTGFTIKENNLKIIDTVLSSQAVLIMKDSSERKDRFIKKYI